MLSKTLTFIAIFFVFQGLGEAFINPNEFAVAIDEFITSSEVQINNTIEMIQNAAKQKVDEASAKLEELLAGPKAEIEDLRKKALVAVGAPKIIICIDKNRSLLYDIPINIIKGISTCAADTILKSVKPAKDTIDTLLGFRNIVKDAIKEFNDCTNIFCNGNVMLKSKIQFDSDVVSIGAKIGLIAASVSTIPASLQKCIVLNPTSITADAIKLVAAAGFCMLF